MHASMFKGIVFVDEELPEVVKILDIKLELKENETVRHLADVREHLYHLVKQNGGNCLCDFKIGQKKHEDSNGKLDFFGSGIVCLLNDDQYNRFVRLTQEEE